MKSGKGSRGAAIRANAQRNAAAQQAAARHRQQQAALAAQQAASARQQEQLVQALNKPVELPEFELPEERFALPTEVDRKVTMAGKRAKRRRAEREAPRLSRSTVLATRAGTRNAASGSFDGPSLRPKNRRKD